MFFFDFTSQSVASPFALDTMLRSPLPPHIGQSPVPGSEAERRTAAPVAIEAKATLTQRRKAAEQAALRRRVNVLVMLVIGRKFHVVDIRAKLGIDEEPGRALTVADR